MSVDNPRSRELLDACRPGDDDLQLDELRPLAEELGANESLRATLRRSQRLDSTIQAAVQRVPIPAGLADRLLAAVTAEAQPPSEPQALGAPIEAAVTLENGTSTSDAAVSAKRSLPRRYWLLYAGATLAATAVAVLLLIQVLKPESDPLTKDVVSDEVVQWKAFVELHPWAKGPIPRDGLSAQLPHLQAVRWQALPATNWQKVVCYDMTPPGRQDVLLFVATTSRNISQLPSRLTRVRDTLGLSVGVWQERGRVYALAVEGNSSRFDSLVRTQLAGLPPHALRG